MSYHVERDRFNELPDEIIVHEDGYLGAWKERGEPIVDYVYRRADLPSVALNGPVHVMFEEDMKTINGLRKLVDYAFGVILGWAWAINEATGFDKYDYTTHPGKVAMEIFERAKDLGCLKE